jgi:hypothetical protein
MSSQNSPNLSLINLKALLITLHAQNCCKTITWKVIKF